ncbi:MAG: hypothetical protein M3N98_07540 [Actinomycetota bacterium]|nr:hypothetical protein [Actinomycetota bacterium]
MLAYVFWHWPAENCDGYEAAVTRFHSAMATEPFSPVAISGTWALSGVPWAPSGVGCYADWYLVQGFADLEALNQVAVSGGVRPSHDQVASRSGGGAGGLYRVRSGRPGLGGGWEAWFAKPVGWTYEDVDTAVAAAGPAAGGVLWQRQLVLGPGPEFCLVTPSARSLPAELASVTVRRRPVWEGLRAR